MRILCLFVVLLLSACSAPMEQEHFVGAYRCDADVVFDAWRQDEQLRMDFMGQEHVLQMVAADDPPHFKGEGMEAWQTEDDFLVLQDARRYTCVFDEPVMAAMVRGVDYRAVGQEPGWLLEIYRNEKLVLHYDYGGEIAELPYRSPQPGEGVETYQIKSEEKQLVVRVAVAPCHDGMSGQPYPDTVSVEFSDGVLDRQLQGCGRPLPTE